MKFGISLPPFGDFADPLVLAEIAQQAENAGWDGFFIWDHMVFDPTFYPLTDPWVALAAIALRTNRIRGKLPGKLWRWTMFPMGAWCWG
jgi:alkanesulfonate monooxygenase SsuD/methylene tetrahydromethanopterin reductase-like flavin-dependent oxidoreductase (luciferase family)